MGGNRGVAAGCQIRIAHPRSRLHWMEAALNTVGATTPQSHHTTYHNGLPQLLVRAHLRQKDGRSIIARTTHLRDRAHRCSASRNSLDPDRTTSPTHHQIQDPTPPFKPKCASSASTSQQCHPPSRCTLLPPCARSTRMADFQLQLQQGFRQDPADRLSDYGRLALSVC